MFYDRKIKYVDVYENEEKVQSAGFIKLEVRDSVVSLQIQVAGLRYTDTCICPVVLLSEEKEFVIGELQLERGKGIKAFNIPHMVDMGGQISYNELEEIQIRPAGNRLLRCVIQERAWKQEESNMETRVEEVAVKEQTEGVEGYAEETVEKEREEGIEEREEKPVVEDNINAVEVEESKVTEEGKQAGDETGKESTREKTEAELLKEAFLAEKRIREGEDSDKVKQEVPMQRMVPQMEAPKKRKTNPNLSPNMEPKNVRAPQTMDKWQQLQAIYPHIRPFEDRREYLLMKPQDFVILPQKYYSLADNSFLLHGYYNYDHLILSKESRAEGEQMYIGVPGNFYDKEKQVAIMFGFESFEGKREPARSGDFGYYMIPVEI